MDQSDQHTRVYGDELPPGTALCHGQYTIEKYLNSGGFGVTYLARDSLERRVVIKECFPNAMCCRAGDQVRLRSRSYVMDFERVVELFEKEARALAHLQHPNVVGVHQIFKDNGTAYMAMDFVSGMDLLDVHEQTPELLTPTEIRALLTALLQALTYVHANDILHRDISPDNILLDDSKTPVLIDFGAAREDATRASRILSRVHTVKDGYSPQEFYFAGSKQSPSSDLYALAATFYHLIAGSPPPNSNERLAAVAENRPDPFEPLEGRFPGQDGRILASIDTCLSLFSKDRFESAAAWLGEISDAAEADGQTEEARDIEEVIARLVDEHKRIIAEKAETPRKKAPAEVKPTPKAEDPKAAAEREYWAILNEDPSEWRKLLEEPEPEPKPAARVTPVPATAIRARQAASTPIARLNAKRPTEPAEFDLSKLKTERTVSASLRRFSISSLLPWSDRDTAERTKGTSANAKPKGAKPCAPSKT